MKNYWEKMARLRELFDSKHPLNYFVMESPAGQKFARIHSYDCCGMGWSDDDYPLDLLLAAAEGCDDQDGITDSMHYLAMCGLSVHIQQSTEIGQDWNQAEAAVKPQPSQKFPEDDDLTLHQH